MRKNLWVAAILLIILLLSGCGDGIEDSLNWKLKEFNAINEEGETMRLADLQGKIWIADFVFTSCATVCPPMTANMTKLQEKLKKESLEVELVSFSVDPEIDTPEMLEDYISKFGADPSNWTLLTGYTQEYIEEYILKNFKTIVKKPETDNQVIHGTSFYLIDQEGKVVKNYDGITVPYDEIIQDAKILVSMEEQNEK